MPKTTFTCMFYVGLGALQVAVANKAPTIKHEPIKLAAAGEPVVVRAVVTPAALPVKSVTLRYATSRDAAPFKLPMREVAPDVYLAAIPPSILTGLKELSYYIEARDAADAIFETPWYTVRFATPAMEETGAPSVPSSVSAPQTKSLWKKLAWVGGGVAGGVAVGLAGAELFRNDDSGGSQPAATNLVGTYVGQATTSLEFPGMTPQVQTYPISITIFENGLVSSDTLHPGRHLEARLSGATFTATMTISQTNLTGQIRYTGTIWAGRISGMTQGSVTRTDTTSPLAGMYSGTFYAVLP
ncbi:MAG: hypothetical protein ACUVWX_00290 [Kiritimatiellia bacterium]